MLEDWIEADLLKESNLREVAENAAKDAKIKSVADRVNEFARIELAKVGSAPCNKIFVKKVGNKPISSEEYSTLKYVLLHIIGNPHTTDVKYPVSKVWHELYAAFVPYNAKCTNWSLGGKDKKVLIAAMKEAGMDARRTIVKSKDVVDIVRSYRVLQLARDNIEKDAIIRELKLQINTSGLIYRGVLIKRMSEKYATTINGANISVRHGVVDKLNTFLLQIDKLLDK